MPQNNSGASDTSHSVSSAASVIEGLLSHGEESEDRETPTESTTEADLTSATEDSEEVEEGTDDETPSASDDEVEEPTEQTDDEPAQPRKIRIKNGDAEEEVTEDELVKGYLRQSDYTRKTQAVAEERKQLEAVKAERAEYATRLTELRQALESSTPQEPDWDTLQTELEPADFASAYARWDAHKKRLDALKAKEREAHEKVARDNAQALAKHIDSEQAKLVDAIPAWKDANVAKKEKAELLQYATETVGFSEDDLRAVTDHRVMVLLRNAFLHHKAQKALPAAKAKIEKVKTVAPGAPAATSKPKVTEETRRKMRLAKTGSLRDAASVFETMLGD